MGDIRNRRAGKRFEIKQFDYEFIPDAREFLKNAQCLDWFIRTDRKYIVDSEMIHVPTFSLRLLDLRDAGEDDVYDISVDKVESFLAEGIMVHNCIPSRMTIGKLIEIVASKVAALQGERINATAFNNFDVDTFRRNLVQYGYNEFGNETLYSGFSGKPLKAQIFTGPCYYQALRHHVKDKIQMRSRGAIKQVSHQPVGGRQRGGLHSKPQWEIKFLLVHDTVGNTFKLRGVPY